jgi:hypothetical protein
MLANKGFIKKPLGNAYFFNNFLFSMTIIQQQFDVKLHCSSILKSFHKKTPCYVTPSYSKL